MSLPRMKDKLNVCDSEVGRKIYRMEVDSSILRIQYNQYPR